MSDTAIVLAGGKGNRMGNRCDDKLLHPLGSSNAFQLCCKAFLLSEEIENLVIVYRDEKQLKIRIIFNNVPDAVGHVHVLVVRGLVAAAALLGLLAHDLGGLCVVLGSPFVD